MPSSSLRLVLTARSFSPLMRALSLLPDILVIEFRFGVTGDGLREFKEGKTGDLGPCGAAGGGANDWAKAACAAASW